MVWLTEARAPEGVRVYAIGDVHGCLDALRAVHSAIENDLAARPVADWRIVHLGDYVDRGADSRGVIDHLVDCAGREPRMIFLRGNHDDLFLRAVRGDRRAGETWLSNGGVETLESYGTGLTQFVEALRAGGSATALVPGAHLDFLDGLGTVERIGDYFFVHAGVDPTLPLDAQPEEASLWIRGRFLDSTSEFDAVIVHGHTPVPAVEVRSNRIGIDTGAVFGGPLTCLVLEGHGQGLLVGQRVEPLTAPRGSRAERAGSPPGLIGRLLGGRLPLGLGRRG